MSIRSLAVAALVLGLSVTSGSGRREGSAAATAAAAAAATETETAIATATAAATETETATATAAATATVTATANATLPSMLPASSQGSEPTPPSFVRAAVQYKGRLWLGTFHAGLYVADLSPDIPVGGLGTLARVAAVSAPFRMVNDALETHGSLYVAANEGLFVTADGAHFARVRDVAARGITALATDGHSLYATSASALWRVRLDRSGPANFTWWRPGGSRSIQGLVVERNAIWLASEDRGVIRFDGKAFTPYDRLAGLPTSWVLAIAGDGLGGVFAATLRDGAMHVDSSGHWEAMEGLPSAWTLSVSRAHGEVCVGTQHGAACYDESHVAATGPWQPYRRLDGLPDQRVHGLLPVKGSLLVATQNGVVVFQRRSEFECLK